MLYSTPLADFITPQIYSKTLSLPYIQRRPALCHRARDVLSVLRSLSKDIFGLAAAIKEQCEIYEIVNRKCGLASLPDDVLAMIFDYSVNNKDEDKYRASIRWTAAVRLSHVCRHFRTISLSCPRLWTTMSKSRRMVAACLPRTKGLPLSVDLMFHRHYFSMDWFFEPVLTEILPHSKRWRHLSIIVDSASSAANIPLEDVRNLKGQKLGYLDAPILEELLIDNSDYHSNNIDAPESWDWSQCNTPNLRRIKTIFCFPRSLPGLANVTNVDVAIRIDDASIFGTLKELSRLEHLRDLALELRSCEDTNNIGIERFEKMEFTRVQHLEIRTDLELHFDFGTLATKCSLFSSLFFPCAVHLQLELSSFEYLDAIGWMERHMYFNKEVITIFRHIDQFPRVDNFRLKIYSPLRNDYETYTELSIPLNMLASLKHFTLQTNAPLFIKEPTDIVFEEEDRVAPRVVGDVLPVLRTLTLDMLDPRVAACWVGEYLEDLREQDKLDGFGELVVMENDDSGGRRTVSYLGREALEWCGKSRS